MLYQVGLVLISPVVASELERESSCSDLKKLVSLVVNQVLMIVLGVNAGGNTEWRSRR